MHMRTVSLKTQNNSLSTFEFRVILENVIFDMKCHDKFGQEPYDTQKGRSKIHSRHNLCI